MKGILITLEGPDGSGKSTQARLLSNRLKREGRDVATTREPGGTPAAESLRLIALDQQLDPRAELLVFLAARAEHVATLIRPTLERGRIVVCDRYIDSSVAYQGYGLGLDVDEIRELNRFATVGLDPDVTLLLDVAPEVGFGRRSRNRSDAIERRDDSFHRRLREGFLVEASRYPGRFRVIDADRPVEAVAEEIRLIVAPFLKAG